MTYCSTIDEGIISTDAQGEQPDEPITQTDPIDLAQPEDPDDQELNENPFILSQGGVSVPANSFVDSRQPYKKKAPPPKYFSEELLLAELPTRREDILRGLEEQKYGGLICTD